jgi:putative membrane protein
MLVFRNQTSYNRFWDGRNTYTVLLSSVRNLTRSFVCCSHTKGIPLTSAEKADVERTVRILIAMPCAVRNHLRAEWGAAWEPISSKDVDCNTGAITPRLNPEYSDLLPLGLRGREDEGLGLPLELTTFIESFIKRGYDRGWYHAPQASQMTVQLNTMVEAYGKMETIHITPVPIAYLIHQKQVLALFGCMLPFAIIDNMGWWSILIVTLVIFTLYGIEGIGSQLEDPFGYHRNDINMNAIVEDARIELKVMLSEWLKVSSSGSLTTEMFMEDDGASLVSGKSWSPPDEHHNGP